MTDRIMTIREDFLSVRGSFRIGGVVDVGTQASLVRCRDGGFVMLDAYSLRGDVEREIADLTRDGADLRAILNVHPFHTVHVRSVHARFPSAALYGTARHLRKLSDLPWEALTTEDPALHERFADDFDFSVPAGVDFISKNENIHFSSVLVYHRASRTIHVDDTLNYLRLPAAVRWTGWTDMLAFHPTLSSALERRPGAAQDFRAWAAALADRWRDARALCAAHAGVLRAEDDGAIRDRILAALERVDGKLKAHEQKHG